LEPAIPTGGNRNHGRERLSPQEKSIQQEEVKMIGVMSKVKELFVSEEGATATEYAVMLALIIIVAIAAITVLGRKVNNTFQNISESLPDPG
jgi:pilus assembly protein Flp/PilA